MQDEWKPWPYMTKEWTPSSMKMECNFCKLELVYKNHCMVVHLGYIKNTGKMWGGEWHCVNIKGWSSKPHLPSVAVCGGKFRINFLMITLRTGETMCSAPNNKRSSRCAQSNMNGNQIAPSPPSLSRAQEVVYKRTSLSQYVPNVKWA